MPAASADLMQQDGVAVGRGARDAGRADHAAGAADVLDDDLLAEIVRHGVGEDARDRVGRPARWERHDQRNGPVGIGSARMRSPLRMHAISSAQERDNELPPARPSFVRHFVCPASSRRLGASLATNRSERPVVPAGAR